MGTAWYVRISLRNSYKSLLNFYKLAIKRNMKVTLRKALTKRVMILPAS
jgi:hypothetical protein